MAKKKTKKRADYTPPARKAEPRAVAEVAGDPGGPNGASSDRVSERKRRNPDRPVATRAPRGGDKSWWFLGVGIVVVIVALLVVPGLLNDEDGVTDRDAWDLPALANDPDGDGRVTLAEFEGKPLVVNFFASWCAACNAELPAFRQAVNEYEDEVTIVFVNSNETGGWRTMAEDTGIDDQIIIKDIKGANGNGYYRQLGGTGAMPITAFYNADGSFNDVAFQAFDSNTLYRAIDTLLVQNGGTPHLQG